MATFDHAAALVRAFVQPERQARWLGLLASPRGRAKFRTARAHFTDLDPATARLVPAADQTPAGIATLLRARGAPATCVLLSEDSALDGQVLPLAGALAAVVGAGHGVFVSCLPGRLAYYEAEDAGERYLLERAV